jgi:hypothetical protein
MKFINKYHFYFPLNIYIENNKQKRDIKAVYYQLWYYLNYLNATVDNIAPIH